MKVLTYLSFPEAEKLYQTSFASYLHVTPNGLSEGNIDEYTVLKPSQNHMLLAKPRM
jgi:hypothetical protein